MSQVNIAVIGAGSISESHLKAYQQNKEANIYAICDLDIERAKAAALKYSAEKVYTDYNELLSDPNIDAISICTWNNTHAEINFGAAFQNEINHFIDCVIHQKESLSPVEDGLEIMKMLCGIYESAAKGVEIHL